MNHYGDIQARIADGNFGVTNLPVPAACVPDGITLELLSLAVVGKDLGHTYAHTITTLDMAVRAIAAEHAPCGVTFCPICACLRVAIAALIVNEDAVNDAPATPAAGAQ